MKTVIGIDYGTQSARALLLSAEDGRVLASYSSPYPHGILPGGPVQRRGTRTFFTSFCGK